MKKSSLFLLGFIIASLTEILALTFEWQRMHEFAKPLILPLLLAFYLASTIKRSNIFIIALISCWAGDVFLLFQSFFIGGLLSFLIGHVLYILAYRQHQTPDNNEELLPTQKMRYSFPIVLTGTGLVVILFPSLGDLKIPVIVYSIVLMVMVMTALFRYGRTTSGSFWKVFIGAALFMTSDSLLAINKFYAPFLYSGIFIMLSYIIAQYLMVAGILKHNSKVNEN